AGVGVQNQVAIGQRQLPQQVLQQGITVAKRQPQILLAVAIGSDDPRYDYLFLSNYATLHVYDALARVHGVGQVVVFGARDYGMRLWLDPAKMARLAVTTQDVRTILNEANALEVAKGVRKVMDSLAPTFPKGIHYVIPYDTTLFVSESVREVVKTLLAAGVLVLLVVFIFLESWRATLIPMLAIPVSLIGT